MAEFVVADVAMELLSLQNALLITQVAPVNQRQHALVIPPIILRLALANAIMDIYL